MRARLMYGEATAYPWRDLPRATRKGLRAASRVRRELADSFQLESLSSALASVIGADVEIVVRDVSEASSTPSAERALHLATADSSVWVSVEPDADFASVVLSRLLGRTVRLVDTDAALDAPLRGAIAALAIEVARRAGGTSELVVRRDDTPATGGLSARATVRVDGRPYGVSAWAALGSAPAPARSRDAALGDLGETPISVPLVAGEFLALSREIAETSPGDAWMPGEGWFAGAEARSNSVRDPRCLLARAVLAAPTRDRGVAVGHSEEGKIVLVDGIVALAGDASAPRGLCNESKMGGNEEDLNQVVLDSPIVVRVEIGTVTLAAREWAALGPGDVLETGLQIAEPVVLRIGGREVARGELVDVEGELGVRIRELVAPGRTP
jgi:flagellar motor switch/type III secretory pathway protein FliN